MHVVEGPDGHSCKSVWVDERWFIDHDGRQCEGVIHARAVDGSPLEVAGKYYLSFNIWSRNGTSDENPTIKDSNRNVVISYVSAKNRLGEERWIHPNRWQKI